MPPVTLMNPSETLIAKFFRAIIGSLPIFSRRDTFDSVDTFPKLISFNSVVQTANP